MPCSDGGPTYSDTFIDYANNKISNLTEMLCSACRVLARFEFDFDENPLLAKWWSEHQKADTKRAIAEKKAELEGQLAAEVAMKPIKDLTAQDKELLAKFGYL